MITSQSLLFDTEESMEESIDVNPFLGRKCKECKRIFRLKYRSGKAFYYCSIAPSNRTANGKRKIKANQHACMMFKEVDDDNS